MIFRPTGINRFETTAKHSRFIAEAGVIVSRETARKKIAEKRREHPDARHVVYAFSYGNDNSVQYAMSDDGEPRNTAGRPVLEVLKGSKLTDCLITVVRYFGGTKLGTGGLVHAYSGVASQVLAGLPREPLVYRCTRRISFGYELYQTIRNAVNQRGILVSDEQFGASVEMKLEIPTDEVNRFSQFLLDLSKGKISLQD